MIRLSRLQSCRLQSVVTRVLSKAKNNKKTADSIYSSTILLPTTTFEQRANSIKKEPEIQQWWEDNDVFRAASEANSGDLFVLHDGPPYANGDLHIGHALNKILKDFINRYQLLRGKKVRFVPGWDCHGLPIELKVLTTLKPHERDAAVLTPQRLRQVARSFAEETIQKQMVSFKRFGVWADWKAHYATMQADYEAAQIRIFGEMVQKGYIYRGLKPVHWSPSTRTALAEAELEYAERHVSRSVYVAFEVTSADKSSSTALQTLLANGPLHLTIWTTTPWTLPANLAVAVNDALPYSIVRHPKFLSGTHFIVASDAIGALEKKFGLENDHFEEVLRLTGKELEGVAYQHPLHRHLTSLPVVVGGDYITADSGTGLVHTAPGHGEEDYATGQRYNLGIVSPVDAAGRFTAEAGAGLEGKEVLGEGNQAVIDALTSSKHLLKEEAYTHKYPYDWRSKKPTIFRATEQWFASISAFRQSALSAIEEVTWVPSSGKTRIASMVASRGDWCISRQRVWGVPIPVFYNKSDGSPLLTSETIAHIEEVFRQHGSDAWWTMELSDLLPASLRGQAESFVRGQDTMDVWFDSGTSWAGVLQRLGQGSPLAFPADLYLEGSDQSRGWFQSSLLTSVATTGRPPYKTVLTHGFTLDEKGLKMSKSMGNVIDPLSVIEGQQGNSKAVAYGADTLRLWAASVDYQHDVTIGNNIIAKQSEAYRKIRNTLRFLLGSLHDFNPHAHALPCVVPYEALPSLDKYLLGRLTALTVEGERGYEEYQFSRVMQSVMQFVTLDLSAFYLDVSKDRLYITTPSSSSSSSSYTDSIPLELIRRRAAQTVLHTTLHRLLLLLAPVLPHLAEEAWLSIPHNTQSDLSLFQTMRWSQGQTVFPAHEEERWGRVRSLKEEANKTIEIARQRKMIGASTDCKLVLWCEDASFREVLHSMQGDADLLPRFQATNGVDDLRFLLGVSQVHVTHSLDQFPSSSAEVVVEEATREGMGKVLIAVMKADGAKCQRCWLYSPNLTSSQHTWPLICARCANNLQHTNR